MCLEGMGLRVWTSYESWKKVLFQTIPTTKTLGVQREFIILQTDYPKTRVNLRQVQMTVGELQKRTNHLDQLHQTYPRGPKEVRGDLDNLAMSIDGKL